MNTRRELRTCVSDYRATASTGALRTGDAIDNGLRRRAADRLSMRRRAVAIIAINALALAMLLHAVI